MYGREINGTCPFCDLCDISQAEMLLHVNSAHLDYLTPSKTNESEILSFIDEDRTGNNKIKQQKQYVRCNGESSSSSSSSSLASTSKLSVSSPYLPQNGWSTTTSSRTNLTNKQDDSTSSSTKVAGTLNNNNNNSFHANTAGTGSPLRSSLNLQLRSHATPKLPVSECPMCPYTTDNPRELEEHINRQHFDLTSPSLSAESTDNDSSFNCPICVTAFSNSSDLELHVNIEHKDILSPAKVTTSSPYNDVATKIDSELPSCPVCLSTTFKNSQELTAHIEEHFAKKATPSPKTPDDTSTDRMLAKDMERREKEVQRVREQREFAMLQAQYGMDNQGNFKEQSMTNMQRAVYAGEMSVSDYYEKQIELRAAESSGTDDGSSCTRGLISRVRAISQRCTNVICTLTCTTVDHYSVTYGDKGWGCGYRNLQMMISSLLQHTGYNELIQRAWSCGASNSRSNDNPQRGSVPSISRLQRMIEWAWMQGFDVQGAEQLGSHIANTKKWIGATEVVTLLSSMRIRCQLVDFHRPTDTNGGHPEMFKWVLRYFQRGVVSNDFKPPLYLQHQGHSRTIIGVEQLRDTSIIMLVLDPSHNRGQMTQFHGANAANAMRLIRISPAAMKSKQYQIVAVIGIMDTETQYQQSKMMNSLRIPNDR